MKDSDLKYKIRLPLEVAMDLLKQIQMDADFLLSLGIMDYSLLGTVQCLGETYSVHTMFLDTYNLGGLMC